MNKEQEFSSLYKEYAPGILKLCLGYTGDATIAEDYVQDTFITVWNNMEKFRRDASWSTWIYRIAVNICLADLRKKKQVTIKLEPDHFSHLRDQPDNKEQQVQLLYGCISKLPETDRLIITMVLEDKEYSEIASIIGITQNNLGVKIHRIKKELTEIFNQYEGF